MPLIPLYIQNELEADDALHLSLLNFCTVFDEVLPFPWVGSPSEGDKAHLLGLASNISIGAPPVVSRKLLRKDKLTLRLALGC